MRGSCLVLRTFMSKKRDDTLSVILTEVTMDVRDVLVLIAEVREDFQREEDQGLLQHDLHKAEQALAGKYACDRIHRAVVTRSGVVIAAPKFSGRAR